MKQHTTWNRRKRMPKTKKQRILAEIAQIVDVAFSIAPNVTWREQIVEEALREDAQNGR